MDQLLVTCLGVFGDRQGAYRPINTRPRVFVMDYHTSPARDVRHLEMVDLVERSFSGACTDACASSVGPVTRANGFDLCPQPHALRRAFFEEMRDALDDVDMFLCHHPPAMCQLYMPFNRSIMVDVTVNM